MCIRDRLAAEKAGLATKVDSLAATPNTLTVAAGKTATFNVTVSPANATGWTITATSGDTAKAAATVNGNTVTLTGNSPTETGKPVTITATAGGKNVTLPVTVTA